MHNWDAGPGMCSWSEHRNSEALRRKEEVIITGGLFSMRSKTIGLKPRALNKGSTQFFESAAGTLLALNRCVDVAVDPQRVPHDGMHGLSPNSVEIS